MKYKNIPIKSRITEAKSSAPAHPDLLRYKAKVILTAAHEGFDYAFRNYSSFDEITDPKFHQIRRQYIKAADSLDHYLRQGFSEDQLEALDNEEDPFY